MSNCLWRKGLVIAIIVLFIGIGVIPITGSISSKNKTVLLEKQIVSNDDLDFDKKITVLMKFAHMPSLSACIIRNNSIVWYKGYRYYNLKSKKIPTSETVYQVASISKTFTATALLQLYERGLFDLDDNVSEYLPFDLKHPEYPDVNITFRMLLAHQASLASHPVRLAVYFSFLGYSYDWLDEYLLPDGGIYREDVWLAGILPGEEFHYANVDFELLGYLIEILSNQSFDQYCKEHIFQPLNMMNTSFLLCDYEFENLAVPYLWLPGFYIPLPHIGNGCSAAGGLRTSISDLSHYLIAHMNGGVFDGIRILENETVELMHSVQFPESFESNFQYGLGWMLWNESDGEAYGGHSGGIIGGRSEMWYRISDKVGVIYFWNQYEFINLGRRPIEEYAQKKIDKIIWEKANELQY